MLNPSDVIIVEGILVFAASQRLRDLMDLKVFVDADADLRLARRVERDIRDRGRSLDGVLEQYMRFVRPSQNNYVGRCACRTANLRVWHNKSVFGAVVWGGGTVFVIVCVTSSSLISPF